MLSRGAESLYWLARSIERMDAMARLIETALRLSAIAEEGDEWRSAIIASGAHEGFDLKYDRTTPERAVDYLALDPDNPSSIVNCVSNARANARAMRTSLTREMWEIVNETWQDARRLTPQDFAQERLPDTLDWVKRRALLFNGAYGSTMLRYDGYWFTRLGTFIERADTTARLIDVKYHVLLPSHSQVGGFVDHAQWMSVLQAASAARAYHWLYQQKVKPWNVAELMILRRELPRSLRYSYDEIRTQLDRIQALYGHRPAECQRLAGEVDARLRYGRIEDIFQHGLHEFLTEMIDTTANLSLEIACQYMGAERPKPAGQDAASQSQTQGAVDARPAGV